MDNAIISENFSLLSKLMDINGENSFKTKTYSIAAYNIDNLDVQLKEVPREKLFTIKGIGDSVGKKVIELLDTGTLAVLQDYLLQTPPGVVEMLNIKGIGPKKIHIIWKEMGIESIGELLYACNENRLTLFKGFGEKTQKNVQEGIEFYMQNQGHFLFAELEDIFPQIDIYLKKLFSPDKVHITGAYRRQDLIIEELEYVVVEDLENIKPKFQTAQPPEIVEESKDSILYRLRNGLKLRLYFGKGSMAQRLFQTTGSASFLEAFTKHYPSIPASPNDKSDEAIFKALSIAYIPPFLRGKASVIEQSQKNTIPAVIQTEDIKSIIHSHSNWSDGVNTIEEMAKECIKKNFEYLVISDHSKAAAYAKGLTEERIKEQHKYIDQLNEQLKPFKIFKSIECDILNDGSLDYSDDVLASFDLVIASVHSNLKMTEEKAMMRLLGAVQNPYTTILGHITGRLLLSREGYPVDHEKIIEACVENDVAIELNAHPRRLDIDWSYIDFALEKGAIISIDPDAHSVDGFRHIKYGVLAAQKGGVSSKHNLSSLDLRSLEGYIEQRKVKRNL